MKELLFVLDIVLLILFSLILYTAIKTRKFTVFIVLFSILSSIALLHDFFGVVKDGTTLLMIVYIPIIIFWFCKLLALIYKKLTGDIEDYNNFIQWFG